MPIGIYKHKPCSKETKEKISKALKGISLSEEHKRRIGKTQKRIKNQPPHPKGKEHYNWKGGITPENMRIRNSIEYRLWREAVFARDNWTCQKCGRRGGNLNAHHVKSFANHHELRTSIENGIILCEKCHNSTKRKIMDWVKNK